jgi:type IV secretory pathway TraG/TraD family ATPase VirD4
MAQQDRRITVFARTNFRNERKTFGIRHADRRFHLYVIGKTGTGKSTLLETLIRQDLATGDGLVLLDPHGDLVERVLTAVPASRCDELVYWNVPDAERPLGFNPLAGVPPRKRALAASGLLEVFKMRWNDSWGPRLEHILRNALLALLEQRETTLADVLRLLVDDDFRRDAAMRLRNAQVRTFWLREFPGYPARLRAEAIAPIQNKVGAFLADPLLYRILTASQSSFDLRRIMDERKVLLVNLAKGKLGEDTAGLLGSLLVTAIGWSAFGRADVPEKNRRDFWVYLDEFQSFTTLSLATMLGELRKYHVGFTLAHQYLAQLDDEIRDAILGNAGTIIAFRLGFADAELLAQEFYPVFSAADLLNLPNYAIYLKLMIDGRPSPPFSAETIPPPA